MLDSSKVTPLSGHVLVRRLPERNVTRGGIHIPQRVCEDAWFRGEVVAVAPTNFYLKPGDRVPFAADTRYMARDCIEGHGEIGSVLFVPEDRIPGVLED